MTSHFAYHSFTFESIHLDFVPTPALFCPASLVAYLPFKVSFAFLLARPCIHALGHF